MTKPIYNPNGNAECGSCGEILTDEEIQESVCYKCGSKVDK